MNFRDNLVHLRAVNNMTQEQLAMLLGVSRQSVAKWEAGKSYPEMDKLISLCQVFNCTLDELVQGDLTSKEADKALVMSSSAKPEDIFGYDELMRKFANRISNGVMAIIMGVAICTLFATLGERANDAGIVLGHSALNNIYDPIGILFLFAGIAIGLAFLISAGMTHSAFVKAHPFIEDFYSAHEKEQARSLFVRELVGGICCIFAGICIVVFLAGSSFEESVGAPLLLLLVAVGVRFIIHGGMTLGRTNLDEYNEKSGELLSAEEINSSDLPEDQKKAMLSAHRSDKRIGAICGTIMMVATIIGLVMLFVPGCQNDYFWLAWPIGGLCCGIASVLIKAFSNPEN